MDFAKQGEWLRAYAEGKEVGRVRLIDNSDGVIHATDLSVDKDAPQGTFWDLIRRTKEECKGSLLRLMLVDNGTMEKLAYVYARMGARPIGIVMEYDATGDK